MYEISVKYPINIIEDIIEKLQINDMYNVYYNAPIVVTTNEYGYGYEEKDSELVDLIIVIDSDDKDYVDSQAVLVQNILELNSNSLSIKKSDPIDFEPRIDAIDLNNGWIIADPSYSKEDKNKINFIHKGAFGSGLHETTQDCLRCILDEDFTGKSVLDIGTGSGILSIAASIKGASKVTALDIRDVKDEVKFNAEINNLNNMEVVIGNPIDEEIKIDDSYDYIFINIGGEETQNMMEFIDSKLRPNSKILVSGLVTWSYNRVITHIESYKYTLTMCYKTNEWCTAWLIKS